MLSTFPKVPLFESSGRFGRSFFARVFVIFFMGILYQYYLSVKTAKRTPLYREFFFVRCLLFLLEEVYSLQFSLFSNYLPLPRPLLFLKKRIGHNSHQLLIRRRPRIVHRRQFHYNYLRRCLSVVLRAKEYCLRLLL